MVSIADLLMRDIRENALAKKGAAHYLAQIGPLDKNNGPDIHQNKT